jgi:hypothetical protein
VPNGPTMSAFEGPAHLGTHTATFLNRGRRFWPVSTPSGLVILIVAHFGIGRHGSPMPYWIYAKLKDGGFSVVVETAKDALAKVAELSETERAEVTALDMVGRVIELATLQSEADKGRAYDN